MRLEVVELGVHRDVATGNVVHVAFLKLDSGGIIEAQLTKESFDAVWAAVGGVLQQPARLDGQGVPPGFDRVLDGLAPEPDGSVADPEPASPPEATYVDRAMAAAGSRGGAPADPEPDETDVDEDGFGPSADDDE